MNKRRVVIGLAAYVAFLLVLTPFNQTWYAPLAWGLAVLAAAVFYWLPSIIAVSRHVLGVGQVVVVNALLGWTTIGWIVALVMAFRHVPKAQEQQAS